MIKDPRDLGKVKHTLEDVLRIALLGTICACDDYEEIHDFVCERHQELRAMGYLELSNGIPSKYTIERVVESVDPSQLRACLDACRGNITGALSGKHVIFDGKKLRGENPGSRGCNGLYILNAWVSESGFCLAEERVGDKTNELTVLPKALAMVWLTGSLVSIDAMGTHRPIALQIRLQGGDYLMALKDNQPILLDLVESVFKTGRPLSVYSSQEKGHGRLEYRECSVLDTKLLQQEGMYEPWPGLKRIIRVRRERTVKGVESSETVYYLSSEEKDDASYYAARIREHWGIEGILHWHLDVTFREDQCRARTGNAAVNLSAMRKYALELLKKQKDKLSLKRRRKKCLMNIEYLANVFNES